MATSAGINIKLTVNGSSTAKLFGTDDIKALGQWVSKNHYLIAREELKKEQVNGFDQKPRVRTDNKFDKPDINVLPFGKIEYFARADVSKALIFAYQMIIDRSPKGLTGYFQSSNYIYYENRLVATNMFGFKQWLETANLKNGSFIRFVNVMPYGSRLELGGIRQGKRGKVGKLRRKKGTARRPFGARRPNGVYFLATRAIRNKYKQAGELIRFDWVGETSGITIPSRFGMRTTYIKSNPKHTGQYIYPSIVFRISAKGILDE